MRVSKRVTRMMMKWILCKYGYPSDLQDAAVQVVLQQAEALSAEWAGESSMFTAIVI